jgi:class 3 adenylate cyclase
VDVKMDCEWMSSGARSVYRSMVLADVEDYSGPHRSDAVRARLRATLRRLIATALAAAGVTDSQYAAQTTGDGLLVTVDPTIGKPRILGEVVNVLTCGLREQNRSSSPDQRLRVRLVVHAADLLIDSDGPLGDQVNLAFRLLSAKSLRCLHRHTAGPLLLCVSDIVYRQVIAQQHEGLDPTRFEAVWLEAKNGWEIGWVCAPGESGLVARSGLLATDHSQRG